jgi:hypothetical protein
MTRTRWWEGAVPRYLHNAELPATFELLKDPAELLWIKEGPLGGQLDADELEDDTMLRWANALAAIDQRGNPRWLLKLLAKCVPPDVFPHLVDLFERRELTLKRKGKPRRPSYDHNGPEDALRIARDHVQYLIDTDGMSLDDALAAVAKIQGIPLDLLVNAHRGRRGASRRRKSAA